MAEESNNTSEILNSIDMTLKDSFKTIKVLADSQKEEIKLKKEQLEQQKVQERLSDVESATPTAQSKINIKEIFSGGIFGDSGSIFGKFAKLGLLAAGVPFMYTFAKGLLFGNNGESGLFKTIGDWLGSEDTRNKLKDSIFSGLSSEIGMTALGTLIFGKRFLIAQLAIKALSGFLEEKINNLTGDEIDIPDGPITTALSLVAGALALKAGKRVAGKVIKRGAQGVATAVGLKTGARAGGGIEAAKRIQVTQGKVTKTDIGNIRYNKEAGRYQFAEPNKTGFVKKEAAEAALKRAGVKPSTVRAGARVVETASKSTIKNAIAKRLASGAGKAVPVLGIGLGAALAIESAWKGDWRTAGLEAGGMFLPSLSGAPLDVYSLARTVFRDLYGVPFEEENKQHQKMMNDILENIKNETLNRASEIKAKQRTRVSQPSMEAAKIRSTPILAYDPDPLLAREGREQRARFADSSSSFMNKTSQLETRSKEISNSASPVFVRGGDTALGGTQITNSGNSVTNITNVIDPSKSLTNAAIAR